jgi:hypothetical protein
VHTLVSNNGVYDSMMDLAGFKSVRCINILVTSRVRVSIYTTDIIRDYNSISTITSGTRLRKVVMI